MPVKIHELNHVAIHVRDLDASIQFYGELLGLPRLPRPAFEFPGAWFAFGRQELHLIADPTLDDSKRVHHHFALLVDDTYETRAYLEGKGFQNFRSHGPRPDGPIQLFCYDPDGYLIELFSAVPDNPDAEPMSPE